jgi:hypothetical protein
MSKIGRSNWILTVTDAGAMKLQRLTGTIDQVWTATPDPRGGAILRHVNSGRVLACGLIDFPLFPGIKLPGGPLKAENLDPSAATQLWRVEDLGSPWVGINTLINWEAKINVYGSDVGGTIGVYRWDGGADNEEWHLLEETGEITVDSVKYDLARAVADLGVPPSHCAAITVNNIRGGTPITSTYTLARSVTTTRSITNSQSETTGHKYTQTFGIKGGIDKVVEVSASASFEESDSKTISVTDQKTYSETATDTLATQVNVPPGKKYQYHVMVEYGKVNVPYEAQLTFKSVAPGTVPVHLTTKGIFTGVNSTNSDIIVVDVTSPQPQQQTLVARTPVTAEAA